MKIASLSLSNNLVLAPMQEVTTSPYRRFCRKFNTIGLVSVPMLYTKRIMTKPDKIESALYRIEEERPISVQLIGSDPKALKASVNYLESYQFDVLDINAGCPSRRAIKAMEGGYLLKDFSKLSVLINIACKYSSRPVSLKIRTGVDNSHNILDIAKVINNSSLEFVSIHGRTVKERYDDSRLDLKTVRKLKESISIPVIGNGDISDPLHAKKFLDQTLVDGLMIGRGSMGNPRIFSQIEEYLKNQKNLSIRNTREIMKRYVVEYEKCVDEYLDQDHVFPYTKESFKFIELKRNSIWLSKDIKNATEIRTQLSKTKNLEQLRKVLDEI